MPPIRRKYFEDTVQKSVRGNMPRCTTVYHNVPRYVTAYVYVVRLSIHLASWANPFLPICVSIRLSIYLSVYLCMCLSFYSSIFLPNYLSTYLNQLHCENTGCSTASSLNPKLYFVFTIGTACLDRPRASYPSDTVLPVQGCRADIPKSRLV